MLFNRLNYRVCFIFLVSCAASAPNIDLVIPEKYHVENTDLPEDPAKMQVPSDIPTEEWTSTVESGECIDSSNNVTAGTEGSCPIQSGILLSEASSWRVIQYKIMYRQMRTDYELDKNVWAAQRQVYEHQHKRDVENLEEQRPSWWNRNDGVILGTLGFICGVGMTVAIVSALSGIIE